MSGQSSRKKHVMHVQFIIKYYEFINKKRKHFIRIFSDNDHNINKTKL